MHTITDVMELERHTGIQDAYRQKCLAVLQALFPDLQEVILFGSRARGRFTEGSDVDLAIDTGSEIENRWLAEARGVINEFRAVYQVDVVDFQAASDVLREMISNDAIEAFENLQVTIEFVSRGKIKTLPLENNRQ